MTAPDEQVPIKDVNEPLIVEISATEWLVAAGVASFVDPDERTVLGMVRLSCDGSRRRWMATNERMLMVTDGAEDGRRYEVLVSPRLVAFAVAGLTSPEEMAVLRIENGDAGAPSWATVDGRLGSMSVAGDRRRYPDLDHLAHDEGDPRDATLLVDGEALAALVTQAAQRALPDSVDEAEPTLWLGVTDSALEVHMGWAGLGRTSYRLAGERQGDAGTSLGVPMHPRALAAALDGWEGDTTVAVPADTSLPVRVGGDGRILLVMPNKSPFEQAREAVEQLFTQEFGPDVCHRDADGDYSLTVTGPRVYARLVEGTPFTLQVFAIVLDGVEATPELVTELNDLNAGLQYARTFHVAGQVLAESDLVASSLDVEELITAFVRVRDLAADLAPVLAAIHGGTPHTDDAETRWGHYRATIVSIQQPDSTWNALNGPDAVGDWPFDDVVHIVTAANPFGRVRPEDSNDADNAEMVRRLWLAGHPAIPAQGSSAGGDHAEAGALFRGLSREDAVAVGRDFDQEAIFEIDADEVRIVGCFTDRIESAARRPPNDLPGDDHG